MLTNNTQTKQTLSVDLTRETIAPSQAALLLLRDEVLAAQFARQVEAEVDALFSEEPAS